MKKNKYIILFYYSNEVKTKENDKNSNFYLTKIKYANQNYRI